MVVSRTILFAYSPHLAFLLDLRSDEATVTTELPDSTYLIWKSGDMKMSSAKMKKQECKVRGFCNGVGTVIQPNS
jgi:hypothetical protein